MRKVKEKAKWTHPRGDINKNEILRIIRNHSLWEGGIFPYQLIIEAKLSKPTVYNHLKKLTREHKVEKYHEKYIITQNDEDIFFILMFEAHLDRWLKKMFTPDETFTIRNDKEVDFTEKNISDFANIVGAFIIYVILASKQPLHKRTLEYEKRDYIVRDAIQGRSFLENILYGFNNYFLRMSQKEPYEVLNKEAYDNLVKAFMRVYPSLYADLEQRWKTYATHFIQESPQSIPDIIVNVKECKHRMEKHYMFNFGEYLECDLCHIRSSLKNTQI